MAVKLVSGGIGVYIGLAADTKPTGVPVGSRFTEADTGARYTNYDGTNWALDGAAVVTPVAQATVNAYADVVGSTLVAKGMPTVSYTIAENNVNAIKWKVLASNDAAFVVTVEAQAEAIVAQNATSYYSTAAAVWAYYKVQVCSSVAGAHGNVTVIGVAKG